MQQQKKPAGSFARWRILGAKYARLAMLTSLTHRQQLPPAVYVLIDLSTPRTAPTNCRVMRISGSHTARVITPGESYCPF